jgi:hypothetical protein
MHPLGAEAADGLALPGPNKKKTAQHARSDTEELPHWRDSRAQETLSGISPIPQIEGNKETEATKPPRPVNKRHANQQPALDRPGIAPCLHALSHSVPKVPDVCLPAMGAKAWR